MNISPLAWKWGLSAGRRVRPATRDRAASGYTDAISRVEMTPHLELPLGYYPESIRREMMVAERLQMRQRQLARERLPRLLDELNELYAGAVVISERKVVIGECNRLSTYLDDLTALTEALLMHPLDRPLDTLDEDEPAWRYYPSDDEYWLLGRAIELGREVQGVLMLKLRGRAEIEAVLKLPLAQLANAVEQDRRLHGAE
ncbi:hypothetical protein QU481_14795 [Crenobacter sp. SG2303]|uniref:Uncharacterized protein n=1 Tax=Crenobacter oryzisoli TaxID=3056844 RepID=A0ABT7XQT4_9NEIS|nr:hypothetical protein [Crenobacter sp. SG2303]MDN0076156.1 hypothetical protein [Crenobacter sp. SG2303]